MALRWKTAWITGASTGIGRELALALARNGVRVVATARGADRLDELRAIEPSIIAVSADVADRGSLKTAYDRAIGQLGAIDLAILNAGIWEVMGAQDFSAARAAHSMSVNYLGIANCLELLIPPMIARSGGHIALVASVAGYRGLPKAAAYAPSKAAVISLAEVLRPHLESQGVSVSLINPGFVETPMTAVNKFPMPFMVKADDAARRIVKGLDAGRFEIAFPWQLVWPLKLGRILPYGLYFWLTRRMLKKR